MSKRKIQNLKGDDLALLRDGIASGSVSFNHLAEELNLRVKDVEAYAKNEMDDYDAPPFDAMITLTRENLHALGTAGDGFKNAQLKLLGVQTPPRKGWLSRLIGREIPKAVYDKVMALKAEKAAMPDLPLSPRQQKNYDQFVSQEQKRQDRFFASCEAAAEILKPLGELMVDGRGGYSDLIGKGMLGGAVPKGRDAVAACAILRKIKPELTEDAIYEVFEKAQQAEFRVLKGMK